MKQSTRHALALAGLVIGLALPGLAVADARQECLNQCTQQEAEAHQRCNQAYDEALPKCAKLATNAERNQCKRQAAQTQRDCNEKAREDRKQCQAKCPAKTMGIGNSPLNVNAPSSNVNVLQPASAPRK